MPFRAMPELVTVYHSTGQAGSLRIKLGNQEKRKPDSNQNLGPPLSCGKTSFGKAKLVGAGLTGSNMTSQSNENDDLSPRKCPNSTKMGPENALIHTSESQAY